MILVPSEAETPRQSSQPALKTQIYTEPRLLEVAGATGARRALSVSPETARADNAQSRVVSAFAAPPRPHAGKRTTRRCAGIVLVAREGPHRRAVAFACHEAVHACAPMALKRRHSPPNGRGSA